MTVDQVRAVIGDHVATDGQIDELLAAHHQIRDATLRDIHRKIATRMAILDSIVAHIEWIKREQPHATTMVVIDLPERSANEGPRVDKLPSNIPIVEVEPDSAPLALSAAAAVESDLRLICRVTERRGRLLHLREQIRAREAELGLLKSKWEALMGRDEAEDAEDE